jgi:two-component system invasion response regulator UvrY
MTGRPGARIRVLLVDDHAIVRTGYRVLLGDDEALDIIAEAETGEGAYQAFVDLAPDIVIMDLSLPGMGGLEATRRIVARNPDARVLVFSMHEESAFVQQALRAGARGYITKSSAPDTLLTALRHVMDGEIYIDPRLAPDLDAGSGEARLAELSPREFSIFGLLSEGLGNSDIAERLCISDKTVANYATQIAKKLGVQNRSELVYLAVRHGLRSSSPPDEH